MNAIISSENLDVDSLKAELAKVPSMAGLELSSQVSTTEPYYYGEEGAPTRIAVLDLGIKKNILRNFDSRQVYAKVFPAKTTFAEMQEWNPDGFFISNGPGDPAAMDYAIQTVKDILAADKPMFGICLGHQILALANDIRTQKMHNGHRGINHPVKNIIANKCEITSQNHGFAVDESNLPDVLRVTHRSLFDGTNQGIHRTDKPAFSFQGHPEASPGPHDCAPLFDHFIELIEASKK